MSSIHDIIGSDAETIVWWQMVIRGILIFFYSLLLIRAGGRRIFGKATSFDIVLGVILGSIMSRALTANAKFFPTLAAATALVLLHRLLSELSRRSGMLSRLVKGKDILLVQDGRVDENALRKAHLTRHDLLEALRLHGNTMRLEDVAAAYLERNGDVSIVSR